MLALAQERWQQNLGLNSARTLLTERLEVIGNTWLYKQELDLQGLGV